MKAVYLILSLIAVAMAGNCGTYSIQCTDGILQSGSSHYEAYISCGFDGFVSVVEVENTQYAATKCAGEPSAITSYKYETEKVADATDKNNANYKATLVKATIRSDDVASFTKGLDCTPAMEQGKTYSMDEIACTVFIIGNIFKGAKDSLNKEVDMAIKFEEESKMTVVGGLVIGSYTKTGSFWGCWQAWSLTLLIVGIVLVIVIIVLVIVLLTKKKGKKDLPKKK